jgi:predicted adenine nucleotide alpha hydrolase (AANH) superfamily ATPase
MQAAHTVQHQYQRRFLRLPEFTDRFAVQFLHTQFTHRSFFEDAKVHDLRKSGGGDDEDKFKPF